MRISELCESVDLDLEKTPEDKDGLGFDLKDDLIFFMNNDDEVYRRHTFPAILKLQDKIAAGVKPSKSLFANAVHECYQMYQEQFNSHKLPYELEPDIIEEICQQIYEDEEQKIKDGHYEAR